MISQVLLIEDDDALRASLTQTLELGGMVVLQANGLTQARRTIRSNFSGVILSDIRMPLKDGFDVLEYVLSVDPDLPVVLLTGEADVPMALRAMRQGAYDFLEKPCATDQLVEVLKRALDFRAVVRQKRLLEQRLRKNDPAAVNFPGDSNSSRLFRNSLRTVAEKPVHVFLHGSPGVGKRLASHTIHTLCEEGAIFVGINFNIAWDDNLSGLDMSDAPTNLSVKNFDLATDAQIKALKLIGNQHPNVRFIVSSDLPLGAQGPAQTELASRLAMFEIEVPDLRQRKADLPVLFETVLRQTVRTLNIDMPIISDEVRAHLMARDWAGNLPELRSYARSIAMGSEVAESGSPDLSLTDQLEAFEALVLSETLRRENGKASTAAQSLGLPRKTFYDRLARYNLRPKDFKN